MEAFVERSPHRIPSKVSPTSLWALKHQQGYGWKCFWGKYYTLPLLEFIFQCGAPWPYFPPLLNTSDVVYNLVPIEGPKTWYLFRCTWISILQAYGNEVVSYLTRLNPSRTMISWHHSSLKFNTITTKVTTRPSITFNIIVEIDRLSYFKVLAHSLHPLKKDYILWIYTTEGLWIDKVDLKLVKYCDFSTFFKLEVSLWTQPTNHKGTPLGGLDWMWSRNILESLHIKPTDQVDTIKEG